MVKNTFAVFGILAVLLLTLGLTSAYTSTQDSIKVTTTTELPNPVAPGSTYIVKVNVTNNNDIHITAVIIRLFFHVSIFINTFLIELY